MRKIITKELAELYYINYKYVNFTLPELIGPAHVVQRANLPPTSSFKDKISHSLYQLIGLVISGRGEFISMGMNKVEHRAMGMAQKKVVESQAYIRGSIITVGCQ